MAQLSGLQRPRRAAKITDEIVTRLRQDIAFGRLSPGERLPNERELAALFGVSQPTVRESVRVLEAMGLVEVRHGSGTYVNASVDRFVSTSLQTLLEFNDSSFADVEELREALLPYTTSRVVAHATDAEIDAIEERASVLEQLTQAGKGSADPLIVVRAAIDYHCTVARASHSDLLTAIEAFTQRVVTSLQLIALQRREQVPDEWLALNGQLVAERAEFIAALRARDEVRAIESRRKYFALLQVRMDMIPELAKLRISDSEATRVLALTDAPTQMGSPAR